jgi:CHAD domain-containing protein
MRALKRRTRLARRQAGRAASAAMEDRSHTLLLLNLASALMNLSSLRDPAQRSAASVPLPGFAKDTLSRRHAKVKKHGRNIDRLAFKDLHRLRISIKRLRYAMEFFEPLGRKRVHDALETLSGLQDLLGRLNDDATAWKLLDALAVADRAAEYQQAVGFMRGWTARDGEQCRGRLGEAWKRFGKLGRWWR